MNIKYLVVHCSDTPNDRETTAEEVHRWHSDKPPKGNGWDGIGYHAVIKRSGLVEKGRPEYWQGSHVRGKNHVSLGVCLIGRDEFTDEQFNSLHKLLDEWLEKYPEANVVSHYEVDNKKTCPNYDAAALYADYSSIKKELEK